MDETKRRCPVQAAEAAAAVNAAAAAAAVYAVAAAAVRADEGRLPDAECVTILESLFKYNVDSIPLLQCDRGWRSLLP